MKYFLAIALQLLSGCVRRVCAPLDPIGVAEFHRSHHLSAGANDSAVEGLASEPWLVCIEGGVATIQNHPAAGLETEEAAASTR